jgi:hypothetical protein
MAMGKRSVERQDDLWIVAADLPQGPGHPFYRRLNQLLAAHGFDAFGEGLCQKFYHDSLGRPGIPPGVYFRMLLIGYFEGLDSERGIAWRCADSRTLGQFLGYGPTDTTPDHSSLSGNRSRLLWPVGLSMSPRVKSTPPRQGGRQPKRIKTDCTRWDRWSDHGSGQCPSEP